MSAHLALLGIDDGTMANKTMDAMVGIRQRCEGKVDMTVVVVVV